MLQVAFDASAQASEHLEQLQARQKTAAQSLRGFLKATQTEKWVVSNGAVRTTAPPVPAEPAPVDFAGRLGLRPPRQARPTQPSSTLSPASKQALDGACQGVERVRETMARALSDKQEIKRLRQEMARLTAMVEGRHAEQPTTSSEPSRVAAQVEFGWGGMRHVLPRATVESLLSEASAELARGAARPEMAEYVVTLRRALGMSVPAAPLPAPQPQPPRPQRAATPAGNWTREDAAAWTGPALAFASFE